MFTLDAVKEELEKAKIDPITSNNAQDYAALIIIHDHLCKQKEKRGYKWEKEADDEDGEEMRSNVIPRPYSPSMPHMSPESRMIGFGNRPREYETRSHYDDGRQEAEVGGTMWMQPVQNHQAKDMMHLDRETAEEWVEHMENSDPSHPRGGKWTPEDLKPLARKLGIPENGEKFWEFYAMMNAMYSDYAPVAKKFGITSPEFYACMAKAWMEDKDAKDDKTMLYYKYIVER